MVNILLLQPTQKQLLLISQLLSKSLDFYSSKFENMIYLKIYNYISCIDLILTYKIRRFENASRIETGLSDFHKMTVSALKMQFRNLAPRILSYRDYKTFSNNNFINLGLI